MDKYIESDFIKLISEKMIYDETEFKSALKKSYHQLVRLISDESTCIDISRNEFYGRLIYLRAELFSITNSPKCEVYVNKLKYIVDSHISLIKWETLGQNIDTLKRKVHAFEKMQWTGKVVDLVELAYGLYEMKVINDGSVDIKAIVRFFGEIFNIEVKNCHNTFREIRRRMDDERAYFLKAMTTKLNERIRRSDGTDYNYQRNKD